MATIRKCHARQVVELSNRPFLLDELGMAYCTKEKGHLGAHEGVALEHWWWWNKHGHGILREDRQKKGPPDVNGA